MISKFHHSIQKGRLSVAIDMLFDEDIDENIFQTLILIKMKLSIIDQAIISGRIKDLELELYLKNDLAFKLLKIYNEQNF